MLTALENEVTKLDRHFLVLSHVIDHEPIGISRLADETGYPKHKIRYSLSKLEDEGLIKPTEQGAIITEAAADLLAEHGDRMNSLIESLDHFIQNDIGTTPPEPEA
jgi:predicted transcriptional regulator